MARVDGKGAAVARTACNECGRSCGLLVLTLLLGRVYRSVICPLGVMQDVISYISGRRKKKKFRFSFSPELKWPRYGVFTVFVLAMIVGIGSFVALLAPYSSYGRIVSSLFEPIYRLGNNIMAYFAERFDSYAFYHVDVWVKSISTLIVAAVTLVVLAVLAWRNGRTYCNTICPVGTLLGFFSRFSLFRITIDTDKCVECGLCSRRCKAACLNGKSHTVDYSRCVACMDCIDSCTHGAISFSMRRPKPQPVKAASADANKTAVDNGRRSFMTTTAVLAAGAGPNVRDAPMYVLQAQYVLLR